MGKILFKTLLIAISLIIFGGIYFFSGKPIFAACGDTCCVYYWKDGAGNDVCGDWDTIRCDGCSQNPPVCCGHCGPCAPAPSAVCGNGSKEGSEQCDDGNTTSGDGCSSSCITEFCGDGTTQNWPGHTEECDDHNTTSGDGCSSLCITEFCGDGIIQNWPGHTEQCDDWGTAPNDGCSATCQKEVWPIAKIEAMDINNNLIEHNAPGGIPDLNQYKELNRSTSDDYLRLSTEGQIPFGYNIDRIEMYFRKRYNFDGAVPSLAEAQAECTNGWSTPPSNPSSAWCVYQTPLSCTSGTCSSSSDFATWDPGNYSSGYYEFVINAFADGGNCTGNRDHDGYNAALGVQTIAPWYDCDPYTTEDESNTVFPNPWSGVNEESDSLQIALLDSCGNGIKEESEECDDANASNFDSCRDNCLWNVCGDEYPNTDGDLTDATQTPPANSYVEECDQGGNNGTGHGCALDCSFENGAWFRTWDGDIYSSEGVTQRVSADVPLDPVFSTYMCYDSYGIFTVGLGCFNTNILDDEPNSPFYVDLDLSTSEISPVEIKTNEEFVKIQAKLSGFTNEQNFSNNGVEVTFYNVAGGVRTMPERIEDNRIVYLSDNLEIGENIEYSESCADEKSCSLLIVVDGSVTITKDVEHIDAFIIASGRIIVESGY